MTACPLWKLLAFKNNELSSSSTSNSAYESSTTDGQTTVVTLFNNQKFDQSIKLNAVHVIIIITMMSSMILIFVKIRKNKKRVI